jgi:hypothetical protein
VDRQQQVGSERVGQLGALELGGVARETAGEHRLAAQRREPALDPAGEVERHVSLAHVADDRTRLDLGVPRVEHDEPAAQVGAGRPHAVGLPQCVRRAAGDGPAQLGQRPQGLGTCHTVGLQAHAALEVPQRLVGLDAEDAVDPPAGVAERAQPVLQRGDVVPAHEVPRGVQQDPVAQQPAGAIERPEGLRAHHTVDEHAAALLERAHGAFDGGVEDVVLDRRGGQLPGSHEPLADSAYAVAAVTCAQQGARVRRGVRHGTSSAWSALSR